MAINDEDFTRLMNQARIKLTGASDSGLKNELFEVFTEFFDVSSSWIESVDLDAIAYKTQYELVVDEGQIVRLGGAAASSTYTNVTDLHAAEALNNGQSLGFHAQKAFMPTQGVLQLVNPPSSPQALRVTVIKNVDLPTTKDAIPVAPDWVIPMYGRYILSGLLGAMMNQPQKSYSNDTQGVYHLKKFQEGISRARVATMRANTYGAQAWNFPQSFKTRGQKGFMNIGAGV